MKTLITIATFIATVYYWQKQLEQDKRRQDFDEYKWKVEQEEKKSQKQSSPPNNTYTTPEHTPSAKEENATTIENKSADDNNNLSDWGETPISNSYVENRNNSAGTDNNNNSIEWQTVNDGIKKKSQWDNYFTKPNNSCSCPSDETEYTESISSQRNELRNRNGRWSTLEVDNPPDNEIEFQSESSINHDVNISSDGYSSYRIEQKVEIKSSRKKIKRTYRYYSTQKPNGPIMVDF